MQVLDDEQERRAGTGGLDQPPHDVDAAMLECLRVQIPLDRRLVGRERRADQSDGVQDAFRGQAAVGDRIRDCATAVVRIGIRADTEQAREQARERASRLDLAEIQHLHAMTFRTVCQGRLRESFEEARLADARFAARHDRAAATRRDRALEKRRHERKFRVTAGERRVPRAERAPQFVGEQDFVRLSAAGLRLRIRHRIAGERKRPVHARRQERTLRDADRGRAVGESARIERLLQCLRGTERALRFVAAQVLESEHGIQPVAGEPVRDAAVQGDRLVERALQVAASVRAIPPARRRAAARRIRAASQRARHPFAARDRLVVAGAPAASCVAIPSSGSAPGSM